MNEELANRTIAQITAEQRAFLATHEPKSGQLRYSDIEKSEPANFHQDRTIRGKHSDRVNRVRSSTDR